MKKSKDIEMRIASLRKRISNSDIKPLHKPTQDLSKIDFGILKYIQSMKQKN